MNTQIRNVILAMGLACMLASQVCAEDLKFSLDDTAFLVGHWRGADSTGGPEEIWLPARDGVMTGFFRWPSVQDHYVLELLTIVEDGDRVIFRFKHFNPDITAWEKEQANNYYLVSVHKQPIFNCCPQKFQHAASLEKRNLSTLDLSLPLLVR